MDARQAGPLPQTLTRFSQLLDGSFPVAGDDPALEQERARRWLPMLLDRHGLRRTVDEALTSHRNGGVVQLVAVWNGYDLALLDEVIDLPPDQPRPVVIDTDSLCGEMDARWPGDWRPGNLPAAILPSGEVVVSVQPVAAALGVEPVWPRHMRKLAA